MFLWHKQKPHPGRSVLLVATILLCFCENFKEMKLYHTVSVFLGSEYLTQPSGVSFLFKTGLDMVTPAQEAEAGGCRGV